MLAKLETAFEHLGFISFAGYLFCAAMLILGSVISAMLKIKMPYFFAIATLLLIFCIVLYALSLLFFVVLEKIYEKK